MMESAWARTLVPAMLFACLIFLPHHGATPNPSDTPSWAASTESAVWQSRVRRAIAASEYHASETRRGLQAPNRAHKLRTYFGPEGIRIHEREAREGRELLGLSLAGVGRGGRLAPAEEGEVSHHEARVEIRRSSLPGFVEWYENLPRGLEQGFTLETRPGGQGPLVLELGVKRARASLHGDAVMLVTATGRTLRYGELTALDRTGRVVASRLDVPAPDRLRLVIDDSEASYPVVIDPLITGSWDQMIEGNQADPVGFLPAGFGGGVSEAGDVNGDGFDDVIVGAPGWDGGDPHEGAAFIFLGSPAGIVGSDPSAANARIESNQFGAQLGTVQREPAGDVNGDGFDDIIVGAHFYSDVLPGTQLEVNGAAFVFHGGPAGITGTDPTNADAHIRANQLGSDLGQTVSGAGDVNGDGFDDVIVGVPRHGTPFPDNIPPNQRSGFHGAALVFHGGPAGITGTGFDDADTVLLSYDDTGLPEPTIYGSIGNVSGAGDVNGDGFADVVVGGSEVSLFLGSTGGIVGHDLLDAQARVEQAGPFGFTVPSFSAGAAGDVNGDGFSDILGASPGRELVPFTAREEGAAWLFLGGPAGLTAATTADADLSLFGTMLAEWVGLSITGVGDVDGDGFDDIAVGARVYPGSLDSEGVVYLFRGSAAGILASSVLDADARLEARQSSPILVENVGAFSVSGAGDVNGDGLDDVIMGKGYWDEDQENEGAAFLFFGQPWPANPNVPPVANAGADAVYQDLDANGSEQVFLDGSASFDPDGTIVSYAWWEGETLLGTAAQITATLTTSGDHELALTVTDDEGLTRGDPVIVRVELVPSQLVFFDGFDAGFGPWITTGDVTLSSVDTFPTAPQALIGASGSSLRRSTAMPAGSTGMTVQFWGKASQFAPADEVHVRVSVDGGPFTTIHTITAASSNDTYIFYGGSAIPIGYSWFPATASSIVLEFQSATSTGIFFVDEVRVRGLLADASSGGCTADLDCDDGQFCNGTETCAGGVCQPGAAVTCNDGVGCTDDACNESTDSCDAVANDANCDDGQFCNGAETCNAISDCVAGSAPCAAGEACNEIADSCDTPQEQEVVTLDFSAGGGAAANRYAWGTYTDSWDSDLAQTRRKCPEACTEVSGVRVDAYGRLAQSDATGGDGDSNRYVNPDEGFGDESTLIVEFNITQDPADVEQIDVHWEGYGDNAHPMRLYIWSYAQGDWGDGAGQFGETSFMDQGSGNADFVLSGSVTANVGDYVSPSGEISVLVYDASSSEDTFHDYISVTLTTASNGCQSDADCNDNVGCTVDTCVAGACNFAPDDARCDDSLFCNGAETCDAQLDCQAGSDPCAGLICDESGDACIECLVDGDCNDGLFCNGAETCVGNVCQPGAAVDCNDGVSCTVDSCDEGSNSCDNIPSDGLCDDGLFCNGAETCDAVLDCQPGGALTCDDGVGCTVDSCNEATDSCDNVANDSACNNGLFCDGAETCDAVLDCQPGVVPCNDGVSCTDDTCNEAADTCGNVANDNNCQDGLFCTGVETCDPLLDCQAGADPCPAQSCDELGDACVDCQSDADCSDGVFCNGAETCVGGSCQPGSAITCDDAIGCTVDSCNEAAGACDNVPDDTACDNGLFCDGAETCSATQDCQPGAAPCSGGSTCDEASDTCQGGGAALWMSFTGSTSVPGIGTVDGEDIVAYDVQRGEWSVIFDGSDVGLGGATIGGMAVLPSGDILMSFTSEESVPGLVGGPNGDTVDESDIVVFTPSSLGASTAGAFTFYFDGSDVGLSNRDEEIDVIALDPSGNLVLSTTGDFFGSGASGNAEDLVLFSANSLGASTSGSFSRLFDGGDVGLSGSSENVDGATFTASGTLLLTTEGSFGVNGVSGGSEDVLEFTPTQLGSSTSGTSTMFLDLSTIGISSDENVGSLFLVE